MLLKNIMDNPISSLIYLERYINNGSLSGFSKTFSTSSKYDPFEGVENFKLSLIHIPISEVKIFGEIPSEYNRFFHDSEGYFTFPMHPDTINDIRDNIKYKISESSFNVNPTSSGRTVSVNHQGNIFYLKLHYNKILCRAKRELPYRKASAGVEISEILEKHMNNNDFEDSFSIFRELFSVNVTFNNTEYGFVFREGKPYKSKPNNFPIIPFFSLTAKDIKAQNDDYLLLQILEQYTNKKKILLTKIIYPILSFYIKMIKDIGITPELNAQNILLELDSKSKISRVIIRDHMGTEKDITLRKKLGLYTDFVSYNYKIIDISINEALYFKRHSFQYDFKLCKYVIEPILEVYCKNYNEDLNKLIKLVKEKFIKEIGDFRFEYFKPYNKWYSHPKIQFKETREYISHTNTEYR